MNALYQNVLGRRGDAAGVAFYNGALARGASRGTIHAAFADSDVSRGLLNNPNVTYAAAAEAQVTRLHDTALGRAPDPRGFNLFTSEIINGATLQQVAQAFLGSQEFAGRYGAALTDQQFVDAASQGALHRLPDAAGEALHANALASGQLSRAGLLAGLSASQERINLIAQAVGARDASGYNIDLTPQLGIIPVVSAPVTS